MFEIRDIGINQSICVRAGAAISHLAQEIQKILERIAQGEGSILRFRLTGPLSAGGSATADIQAFDGSGFSRQRTGSVHDEEPGGLWSGVAGDEGWCTARDNETDEYSIIFMSPISGLGGIGGVGSGGTGVNSTWLAIIGAALNNTAGFALATLSGDLTGGATATITGFDWKGELPLQGTAPTEASNPEAHRGLSGDQVVLLYNAEDSVWTIVDVAKHAQTVVFDIRDDGTDIQAYVSTCAVEYGSAPAWVSKITPDAC
jgi:hypothetical protein